MGPAAFAFCAADVSSSSDEDDEEAGSASDASLQSDEEEGEEGSEDLAAEMYEGSDELDEMEPQEWGVGALAANPEEPIPQGEVGGTFRIGFRVQVTSGAFMPSDTSLALVLRAQHFSALAQCSNEWFLSQQFRHWP